MLACKCLKCYISQDKDGFVQIWMYKPKRNLEWGVWEGREDPKISPDNPLIAPYTTRWAYSLITPKSFDMTFGNWK